MKTALSLYSPSEPPFKKPRLADEEIQAAWPIELLKLIFLFPETKESSHDEYYREVKFICGNVGALVNKTCNKIVMSKMIEKKFAILGLPSKSLHTLSGVQDTDKTIKLFGFCLSNNYLYEFAEAVKYLPGYGSNTMQINNRTTLVALVENLCMSFIKNRDLAKALEVAIVLPHEEVYSRANTIYQK